MSPSRFDMAENCQEALLIFADSGKPEAHDSVTRRYGALRTKAISAMEACDKAIERDRLEHGALLLFLCGIDDLEKYQLTSDADERTKFFNGATRKLHSARFDMRVPDHSLDPPFAPGVSRSDHEPRHR
jgi:hypothetical protein